MQNDMAQASVESYNTYYPFGMLMQGANRNFSSEKYRYGFNGKEMDNDMSGGTTGAVYDYGFRIYDSRIGKFLSVDPLTKDYPGWSPYPFAMNRVIDGIDLDGLEFVFYTDAMAEFINGVIAWDSDNTSYGTKSRIGENSIIFDDYNVRLNSEIYKYKTQMRNANNVVFPESTGKIRSVGAFTKQSNYTLPDRRVGKTLNTKVKGKVKGRGLLVVDGIIWGFQIWDYVNAKVDKSVLEDQIQYMQASQNLFVQAVLDDFIPSELLNDATSVSNIMNYIYRGDLSSPQNIYRFTNDKGEERYLDSWEYKFLIMEIGEKIYNGSYNGKYTMPEGHTWDELKNPKPVYNEIDRWTTTPSEGTIND